MSPALPTTRSSTNPQQPRRPTTATSAHDSDPWSALLWPALRGPTAPLDHRFNQLRQSTPPARMGELLAVWARSLFAQGRHAEASVVLEDALATGHIAAQVLASVASPDGQSHAAALLKHANAGVRADAACDRAAWEWRRGQPDRARPWVDRALCELPHHCEARRWHRMLRAHATGRPTSADLVPIPTLGWLSPERSLRRLAAGTWLVPAPPASALFGLQQLGVLSRVLATQNDYRLLSAQHPLVSAERALDQALSIEREGGAAGEAAQTAWHAACLVDDRARQDAAGTLVALGVRDSTGAPIGLVAADLLRRLEPDQVLWRAYETRLLALLGEQVLATRQAEVLLGAPKLDPVSLVLCLDVLRAAGHHDRARRRAVVATRHPLLQATAQLMLADWDNQVPLAPVVSNRVVSRLRPSAERSR
jgi:hypothetical protein